MHISFVKLGHGAVGYFSADAKCKFRFILKRQYWRIPPKGRSRLLWYDQNIVKITSLGFVIGSDIKVDNNPISNFVVHVPDESKSELPYMDLLSQLPEKHMYLIIKILPKFGLLLDIAAYMIV